MLKNKHGLVRCQRHALKRSQTKQQYQVNNVSMIVLVNTIIIAQSNHKYYQIYSIQNRESRKISVGFKYRIERIFHLITWEKKVN